jgi:hypothetical protein
MRPNQEMRRRDITLISQIGSCALSSPVTFPVFFDYVDAMALGTTDNTNTNNAIYDAIEKYYSENLQVTGPAFNWSKITPGDKPGDEAGAINQVWEKANLVDFFASVIGSDFDCDDLNQLASLGNCTGSSVLQQIFDTLPSMSQTAPEPGFAAMSQGLNGMKGWVRQMKASAKLKP